MRYLVNIILILAFIGGTVYILREDIDSFLRNREIISQRDSGDESPATPTSVKIEYIKEILTPGPLHVSEEYLSPDGSTLTESGVIFWTNFERSENGLQKLKENNLLTSSAQMKIDDMIASNYFDHISPAGIGIDGLGNRVGYEYIIIGENLALGDFENNKALVNSWMDSPGHRANILNKKYTEIGVGIGRMIFEGEETWIIVQHFGRPLTACSEIDNNLKTAIEENNEKLEELKAMIDSKSAVGSVIDVFDIEYQKIVNQYNELIKETQIIVDEYNAQVETHNICIQS